MACPSHITRSSMCRASGRRPPIASSCVSGPPIPSSIGLRPGSSWRAWSHKRYPMLSGEAGILRAVLTYLRPVRARGLAFLVICAGLLLVAGCGENMRRESRVQPYEPVAFYPDEQSARPVISGTIALGMLQEDELLYTGKIG